ncbi:MAG TPA: caspase family protein [Thermoanaerobaculia bacterium]|nr:caspase family protein [Thermoanaerobaculia bacterium]
MSELHALLIGIDAYLPNRMPSGGWYPQLAGCVRDVERVEAFLRDHRGLAPERLHKLTASASGNGSTDPIEPRDRWPTYENIVAAFQQIMSAASPGAPVYIHYSGHGGRVSTAYPEIKGEGRLDETLVPVDIGDSEARYLRDVELAHFMRKMVDRGLLVTLVLDSCHSGGATRDEKPGIDIAGKRALPRGVTWIDTSKRRTDSLVAAREELLASWPGRPATGSNMRDFLTSTGWLPDPKGYTLIAACTSQQTAFEYPFEGEVSSGALTHFLLAALDEPGADMTYETLYNRLRAQVQNGFPRQTPVIVGERERPVLGSHGAARATRDAGSSRRAHGIVVLGVDETGRLRLNTGQAQGVLDGARFAVHPPDAQLESPGEPLAEVEVVQYGGTESLAEVKGSLSPQSIPPGSRAVLLDPGPNYQGTAVRLVYQGSTRVGEEKEVLGEIADRLAGTSYLRLTEEGTAAAFQVALNDRREIEIQNSTGTAVPYLRPALSVQSPDAAATTVARLVHLAKYRAVRELENRKAPPDLAGQLVIELLGIQDEYDTSKRPDPRPGTGGKKVEMRVGQWTFLRISNRSSRDLNIAVLDLQPDWGITQIYPGDSEDSLITLDPEESFDLPLKAQLPQGIDEGTDMLKVFATLAAADFRFLELPPLDRPPVRTMEVGLPSRHPEWYGAPHKEWVTVQVEVRISGT